MNLDNKKNVIELLDDYDKKTYNYSEYYHWLIKNYNIKEIFSNDDLVQHYQKCTPKNIIYKNFDDILNDNLIVENNKIISVNNNKFLLNLKLLFVEKKENNFQYSDDIFSFNIKDYSKEDISFISDEFNVPLYIKFKKNKKKFIIQNSLLENINMQFEFIARTYQNNSKYLLWEWANINANKNNPIARKFLDYGLDVGSRSEFLFDILTKSYLISSKIKNSLNNIIVLRALLDHISPKNTMIWIWRDRNRDVDFGLVLFTNFKQFMDYYEKNK